MVRGRFAEFWAEAGLRELLPSSREEVDDREEVCITEIKSLTRHISYGSENGCQF